MNDVILNSPAGKAGIGPGMQLIAVNGLRFSADVLRNAIRNSKTAPGPLTIEFQNDDLVKTVSLDYLRRDERAAPRDAMRASLTCWDRFWLRGSSRLNFQLPTPNSPKNMRLGRWELGVGS